jgi:enamine deaminase RidA (YjgF/YER057c/UK114 family)
MRVSRAAIVMFVLVSGLSAQSGKQFVRPPAGQTPPYNLAIKAGGAIYVAGQLPTDEKGALVTGDITAQATQVFTNLRGILQQAGSSLDNVVHATVMLQNASDFPTLARSSRSK